MEKYSINELGGFITVCAGAIATILFAIQKSSCTSIKCCGCECKRDPKLVKKHLDPNAPDTTIHKEEKLTPSNP